ncbi:hypothetical protein QMTAC487_17180 [Sphaerotilus sp. FB-3]|nr:hypothetical protein QMTAC487_17180 [Sphaerotilus sp. FB-3]
MPSLLAATISALTGVADSQDAPTCAQTAKVATRLKCMLASGTEAATTGAVGAGSSLPPPQALSPTIIIDAARAIAVWRRRGKDMFSSSVKRPCWRERVTAP